METKGEISKTQVSLMGGCLPSAVIPTRATRMPNVWCLLSDVGVMDVPGC